MFIKTIIRTAYNVYNNVYKRSLNLGKFWLYSHNISNFVLDNKSGFVCPKGCGRRYKQKCTLNRHLKFECGIQPMFKCNMCGRCFRHTFTLKFHLADAHMIV